MNIRGYVLVMGISVVLSGMGLTCIFACVINESGTPVAIVLCTLLSLCIAPLCATGVEGETFNNEDDEDSDWRKSVAWFFTSALASASLGAIFFLWKFSYFDLVSSLLTTSSIILLVISFTSLYWYVVHHDPKVSYD